MFFVPLYKTTGEDGEATKPTLQVTSPESAIVPEAPLPETNDLDSYQTWDMSATYATPWNGTVTVGARNIFDEDPPTSVGIGSPFYSNYLHDVYGRVPYVRYEQDL